MNSIQEEIIRGLKEKSLELGHSPKKREVPNLAIKCYKHFGSFNRAKLKAKLDVRYTRQTIFPKSVFNLDKDMARIASYLTFDGHLYKDLSGFMFSSKNIGDLEDFEKIVKRKFNLPPRYHINNQRINNQAHQIFFFNNIVAQRLFELGIPKGDKVIQKFNVPRWITSSKEFSKEYLKIAYLCEGCNKEEKCRKNTRIQINTAKSEEILESGIEFMNELRIMLDKFGIYSTDCRISGNRIRKRDNKITKDIRFRIFTRYNDKFMKEIGWLK